MPGKTLLFKDVPPSVCVCTVITQIWAFRKTFLMDSCNHGLNNHILHNLNVSLTIPSANYALDFSKIEAIFLLLFQ